jgi:tryptophanyl-tRNA synthetase
MSKPVILTGLRSNGEFHLGNYLGAILPIVKLQKTHAGDYQVNMFVPDLHSFTTPVEHGNLYQQSINNLKIFVASGLDFEDKDTYIYRQSYIPAHSELAWILGCFTYFGELSRMTQFKDKSQQLSSSSENNITAGIFNYPTLMSADILLYGAQYVPLGEDQRQHIELARDVAIRMNNKFGDLFVVPHEWSKQLELNKLDKGVRIRSLRNPDKKMSKSIDDPSGTIMLSDLPDQAAKKIMGATTDSLSNINYDWDKQPGITNLLQILALLTDQDQATVNARWQGKSDYGTLKAEVAEAVSKFLSEIQLKLTEVDEQALMAKLAKDEVEINKIANKTLLNVQTKIGLRP